MRKRFPITPPTFEFKEALTYKNLLIEENRRKVEAKEGTERHFQIRKYHNGFRVVERLETTEAEVVQQRHRPKKRPKRGRPNPLNDWKIGKHDEAVS